MRHLLTPINLEPKVYKSLCISLIISMSANFGIYQRVRRDFFAFYVLATI